MSKTFTIRDDIYERLKSMKADKSFSEVLDGLLEPLNQATVNNEGRFEGSKSLAGKRIEYRIVK